jgi:predicted nucleic acid-binding protein
MAAVKVFWDTNVLLDFIDRRPFELESIDAIFELAVNGQIQIASSEQVICTVLYLSDILRPDLAIAEFLRTSSVLPTNKSIILTALSTLFKDKEDAILYHLALNHRVDFFVTRDKKPFEYARPILPVLTPGEYVRQRSRI